jgi:hypothetical protein
MCLLGACDLTYPCCRRGLRNHWPFNFLVHASNSAPRTGARPLPAHTARRSCTPADAASWPHTARRSARRRMWWRGPARLADPHAGGCGSASPRGLQPRKPARCGGAALYSAQSPHARGCSGLALQRPCTAMGGEGKKRPDGEGSILLLFAASCRKMGAQKGIDFAAACRKMEFCCCLVLLGEGARCGGSNGQWGGREGGGRRVQGEGG